MGLAAGDNVLFPALRRPIELDPFLALGIEPRFYEPERLFGIPAASLEALSNARTHALLVIHYLGLPQDLREVRDLCRRRGWRLIEDCAHTLPAGAGERGAVWDVPVFSRPKLLPLPDDGALCVNAGDLSVPTPPRSLPAHGLTPGELEKKLAGGIEARDGRAARLARERLVRPTLRALRRLKRGAGHRHGEGNGKQNPLEPAGAGREDPYVFHPSRRKWEMSRLSGALLRASDWEGVAEARRRNFSWLLRHLAPSSQVRYPPPEGG